MRVNRRWLDAPEGDPLFVDSDRLGRLVAAVALGGMPVPEPTPDLPAKTRVSIRRETDGVVWHDGAWTVSPPIRAYDGRWYVAASTSRGGIEFVPVDSIIRRERNGRTE